jgi:DNA-binding GntR family transcriptional regulator
MDSRTSRDVRPFARPGHPASLAGLVASTPPETLGGYVLNALRGQLAEGQLLSGMQVSATTIATQLGVSHIPVREALRYLEAQGHLTRHGRGGLIVAETSASEFREIVELRELLEAHAHLIAMPRLSSSDFKSMQRSVRLMGPLLARKDLAAYTIENRSFHFVPIRRSEQPWLQRMIELMWDAAARYQAHLIREPGWEERLQEQHRELVDAFQARDIDRVTLIMRAHRTSTVLLAETDPDCLTT